MNRIFFKNLLISIMKIKNLSYMRGLTLITITCIILCHCKHSEQYSNSWGLHMERDYIKLSDNQFFSNPLVDRNKIDRAMFFDDFTGIVIGSPYMVNIERRSSLPLVSFNRRSFDDNAKFSSRRFSVVVTIDLDRGFLYWNMMEYLPDNVILFPMPDDLKSEAPSRPKGSSTQVHSIDLRERLGVEWQPSNLLTTVFLYDQYSNRQLTTLFTKDQPDSESISEFATNELSQLMDVSPSDVIPVTPKEENPLPEPSEKGLVITTDEKFYLNKNEPLIISGSFLIPVFPHERTTPENGESPISAVIPLALIISGSVDGCLGVFQLHVPVIETIMESEDKSIASGFFRISLSDHINISLSEQSYTIFAMSRQFLSEPLTIEVIEEKN
ncbi:hypothetical protein CHISP_2910 [Chitinispirillum alkaliphilum]|nr:hypothetical protein CHISP_2910 [Chitinispirillum alkaliphilum]